MKAILAAAALACAAPGAHARTLTWEFFPDQPGSDFRGYFEVEESPEDSLRNSSFSATFADYPNGPDQDPFFGSMSGAGYVA